MATPNDKQNTNLNKNLNQENQETVEFHSEMPQVPDDKVNFVPDEQLEEEINE